MMISSDLSPLPIAGEFLIHGSPATVECADAMNAVRAGMAVRPADAATAERVAARLSAAGNGTRAAMFRRVFDVAPPSSADSLPASERPSADAFDPDADSARVRELVDAAGDDATALRALASRYRVDYSERWGARRLANQINREVSARIAGGKPATQ